nr:hypothetical protein [Bacteroidota bacterium]
MNVIKSRETLSEVGIRLVAQGLVLENYNPIFISRESFISLRKTVPQYIKDLVVKPLIVEDSLSFTIAYNQTVENLIRFKNSSDTNFIYNLLNYTHRFYSIKALSRVSVKRIQSSDILELTYEQTDPGIAMQTLIILTKVFINNFKNLKENQSDVVVDYFEQQVNTAQRKLKQAEDRLLEFNTDNNIINYYEQSKFIAGKKESIEEYIQNEKMKLSGAEEAIKNIESKLQLQGQVQTISENILNKRNKLVEVTEKITINELYNEADILSKNELAKLRTQAESLKLEINEDISKLYNFKNTIEGLPISELLTEWLRNVLVYAEAKAGLQVLTVRQKDFMKNYEIFAPLGATMKRIEREIDVSESEYLSLLHSLNMARLRQKNESLTTNIKPLDAPYFPLSPKPSKRKILVIAAAMIGFLMVAFAILLTEYLDNTIKTIERAEKLTGFKVIGLLPRIVGQYSAYNLPFITNRLIELLLQEMKNITEKSDFAGGRATRQIIFFSPLEKEGKTFVVNKIINKIRSAGEKVLYLNYTTKTPDELIKEKIQSSMEQDSSYESKGIVGMLQNLKQRFRKVVADDFFELTQNKDNLVYHIDDSFTEKQDIFDLIQNTDINTLDNYKYVFTEIPAVLFYSYPSKIIEQADLSVLVVRSNRDWTRADTGSVQLYSDVNDKKPYVFLNGTDINEIEVKLGTLPKKRSRLRRIVKHLVNFQFYTKQTIK